MTMVIGIDPGGATTALALRDGSFYGGHVLVHRAEHDGWQAYLHAVAAAIVRLEIDNYQPGYELTVGMEDLNVPNPHMGTISVQGMLDVARVDGWLRGMVDDLAAQHVPARARRPPRTEGHRHTSACPLRVGRRRRRPHHPPAEPQPEPVQHHEGPRHMTDMPTQPPPERRPNRAERRAAGVTSRSRPRRSPPIVARDTDGQTSGAELGAQFEGSTLAKMPGKRHGKHRWVAVASYVFSDEDVAVSDAPGSLAMLDSTRMIHLALGCWDCGRSKGQAEPGSFCPGAKP
jgi:hypothetical protein